RLPPERRASLGLEIQRAVLERCGLRVDDVVVAGRGTIPKTTSGKVQRAKAAALHAAGRLAPRRPDGVLRVARNLLHSQLAHLRRGGLGGAADGADPAAAPAVGGGPARPAVRRDPARPAGGTAACASVPEALGLVDGAR
ncbi:MAG TPA: hypothetical protein VLI67_10075, partial [Vicinamibacteria bacterium]|nr:hypothetical protein [Vicinamibacteria bacterium]